MSCVDEIDLCVIRGDAYELNVGLSGSFTEVLENPTAYIGRLVFREDQDDDLPHYLELTAVPEVDLDLPPGEVNIYLNFAATAAETQSLPDWKYVAFCELTQSVNPQPQRLFNAEVDSHD